MKIGKKPKVIIDRISIDYPDYQAILIRCTFPMLERNLKPHTDKLYKEYGGVWQERNHCYVFPSGAKVYLVHLKDRKALDNYIGGNYNFIGIDEANQFPEDWIDELTTSVRTDNWRLKPQLCLTSNPGNVGHIWLKRKYVDRCMPIPKGDKVHNKEFDVWYQPMRSNEAFIDEEGLSWKYIPATVFDNPTILKNDKAYVRQLKNLNPVLRAMWLEGSWDHAPGMFFDNWNYMYHVIPSQNFIYGRDFSLETHKLYRFYDYGTKNPFACLFAAVDKDQHVVIFDEIVERGLSASRQVEYVNEYTLEKYRLQASDFTDEICDPAYFVKASEKEGSLYSPADFYQDGGIFLTKGNNDRKTGAKIFYDALDIPDDEIPRLRFTDQCEYCIETIPNLTNAENDPEDVDSDSEDHAYDAARYGIMTVLESVAVKKESKLGWRDRLKQKIKNGAGSWKAA
jgi:hypothetical protein